MIDVRSPLMVKIMNANLSAYKRLMVNGETPTLARELLAGVEPASLFAVPVNSPVAAYTVLAALWLWHDGLEEAHKIVQQTPEELENAALNLHRKTLEVYEKGRSVPSIENRKAIVDTQLQEMTTTLAFWHAIMHRREGDFSNSKYWYRNAGTHGLFDTIAARASEVINPFPVDKSVFRLIAQGWDPAAFVDLADAVHNRPQDPRHPLCVAIQQIEWHTLFEHCTRAAAGR